MTDPLIKPGEVARTRGVTTKTVRGPVNHDEIDAFSVAGRRRLDPESVECYLQDHRARSSADRLGIEHRVTAENR